MIIIGQVGKISGFEQYTEAVMDPQDAMNNAYGIRPGQLAIVLTSEAFHSLSRMTYGMIPRGPYSFGPIYEAPIQGGNVTDLTCPVKKKIITQPEFRYPIRFLRCIVPVNYFILIENNRGYLFHKTDRGLFSLAGIYDYRIFTEAEQKITKGFSILTWPAYGIFRELGMSITPFVLPVNRMKKWVRSGLALIEVTQLMQKSNDTMFQAFEIDNRLLFGEEITRENIVPISSRLIKPTENQVKQSVKAALRSHRRSLHQIDSEKKEEETKLWRNP